MAADSNGDEAWELRPATSEEALSFALRYQDGTSSSPRGTVQIERLRARVARLERRAERGGERGSYRPFGHPDLDACLPGGGLALGALHEVAGTGPNVEHGAAAALFVAGVLARLGGTVLWVLEHRDLFAPALAGAGLHPGRVIYAEEGRPPRCCW